MSAPTMAAPVAPPRSWFVDPKLSALTPMTVTPDGRVFGHLASWKDCHVESAAMGRQCVTAPKSKSNYARFHLGAVMTAEGESVPTGPIVLGASHAETAWNANATMEHYSNTAHAVADIRVGEDKFGIWVAGALRPTATPEQVRTLRASPLSGDWRGTPGSLELVAALAVNNPGFAIQRPQALIASAGMAAAFGIGVVQQPDPRVFALRAMRVETERLRRPAESSASISKSEQKVALFEDYLKRRRAEESDRQQDESLVASMSLPTSFVQDWEGPIAFEGEPTGDGRLIGPDALSAAAFPLSLRWVVQDVGAHDGAVVVGRIDSIERRSDGTIFGRGVLDLGQPAGREVARQIAGGFAGGVSVDLDSPVSAPVELNGTTTSVTTSARVRAATVVAIPAFADARIALVGAPRPGSPTEPDCECDAPQQATTEQENYA